MYGYAVRQNAHMRAELSVAETYNVGAGIALSRDVQRARLETWEDFDQIGKEVHLWSAMTIISTTPAVPQTSDANSRSRDPFDPHRRLHVLSERHASRITFDSPNPFASAVEKPVPLTKGQIAACEDKGAQKTYTGWSTQT